MPATSDPTSSHISTSILNPVGSPTDHDVSARSRFANKALRRSSSRIERWLEAQMEPAPGRDELRGVNAATEEPSKGEPTAPVRRNFPFLPGPIFHTPSPLRNFHRAFHVRRSSASSFPASRPLSPDEPTHGLPAADPNHSRGSSLSTATPSPSTPPPNAPQMGSVACKSPRPSIMDLFSPAPEDASDISPARPSSSSSVSFSSVATPRASTEAPSVSQRLALGSVRSHSSAGFFSSSPSLWSLPADASHMNDAPDSEKVIAHDRTRTSTVRIPLSIKSHSTNTSSLGLGPVSIMLTSPKARKKRKLIVSGIPASDERRVEAVRKWCETFGEVNQIVRAPSGDLHVDFRSAEVADTVCRLNARVYISGVGSVCLSWFTGRRP